MYVGRRILLGQHVFFFMRLGCLQGGWKCLLFRLYITALRPSAACVLEQYIWLMLISALRAIRYNAPCFA